MRRRARPRAERGAAGASEIRVRRVARVDIPRLESLLRDVDELHERLWPSFFRASRDGRRAAALLPALRAPDEFLVIAEGCDRLLGFVHARIYDTPDAPTLVRARRLKIEELAVAATARRKGVGRRLVGAAVDWGARQGAVEAVLVVWENNAGAERFYRAAGFRPLHRVFALPIDAVAPRRR